MCNIIFEKAKGCGRTVNVESVCAEAAVRRLFLQNSTGRLLLIIAVSIVAKGVLVNETVNYETRTKAYVLI